MTTSPHGRRTLLKGLAAAGVAGLLRPFDLAAQGGTAHRIDVHQHFVSPAYLATLHEKNRVAPVPGLANWEGYTPARAVEQLDRAGIGTAILSLTAPGAWFGEAGEARRLARELNEYAASRMVSDHRGRFGLFAVLPLPDIDGSLVELTHALDVLRADGVGLLTNYGDRWLGDAHFDPLFEELNRRQAIVYTHPTDASCCPNPIAGVAPQLLEYPTDTTRIIINLIVGGAAARYPEVRVIFSHAGGTLTAVAGRFLGAEASARALDGQPPSDSRLAQLRRFYYDTAGAANPISMEALRRLVTSSQILFGSDAPFFDAAATAEALGQVGFSAAELRAIERENAWRLLPALRRD